MAVGSPLFNNTNFGWKDSSNNNLNRRRRDNTSVPLKHREKKKPSILYNQFGQKKASQKTNPFHGVHKGLVASRHAQRSIQKLSNVMGSFQNCDDLQVVVQSPRTHEANIKIIANSFNSQIGENLQSQFPNFNFQLLQSSGSPKFSNNASKDLSNQSIEFRQALSPTTPTVEGYTSIKSQNFSFNAQPSLGGIDQSKDGLVVMQVPPPQFPFQDEMSKADQNGMF